MLLFIASKAAPLSSSHSGSSAEIRAKLLAPRIRGARTPV